MESYERLEEEFSKWTGLNRDGMVSCSSGTAALHLALESLQLPLGSKIITSDFSMIACARAVTLAGLEPVFVDCDDRLLMDMGLVEQMVEECWDGCGKAEWKAGREISAVLPVHNYGRTCDMFRLRKATESYGIKIVEDLAEAHGIDPYSTSDAATWSFFRNKILAGQEGGMCWFRDKEHALLARKLKNIGFTDAHDYTHIPRGHNYRLANSLADLVLDSLSKVSENQMKRRQIEGWYDSCCPEKWRMHKRDAVWVYDLRIPGLERWLQNELIYALGAEGIQARHGFKPMTSQLEYFEESVPGDSNANKASKEVIYLPCTPGMVTEETCRRALETCRRLAGHLLPRS